MLVYSNAVRFLADVAWRLLVSKVQNALNAVS